MAEVELSRIELDGKVYLGIRVDMPNAPLLIIKGERGYAMCGYLNTEIADKLRDAAVMVSGIKSFEDMLDARIKWVSSKAKELGVQEGKMLREELRRL